MKQGTQDHVKFRRLKRLLKVPLYQAIGIMESLWLCTAACAEDGDIGKFSNEEIADWMEWEGDADHLVTSIVQAGWVDEDDEKRLIVHDWRDHCPDYIKKRLDRKNKRLRQDPPDSVGDCPPTADNGADLEQRSANGALTKSSQVKPSPTKSGQVNGVGRHPPPGAAAADSWKFSDEARALANKIGEVIRPQADSEKSVVAKAATVAVATQQENFALSLLTKVRQRNPDSPMAYWRGCMRQHYEDIGENFERLIKRVDLGAPRPTVIALPAARPSRVLEPIAWHQENGFPMCTIRDPIARTPFEDDNRHATLRLFTVSDSPRGYEQGVEGVWCDAVWAPSSEAAETWAAETWAEENYGGTSDEMPQVIASSEQREGLEPEQDEIHRECRLEVLRQAGWQFDGDDYCDACGLYECGLSEFAVCSECHCCPGCRDDWPCVCRGEHGT